MSKCICTTCFNKECKSHECKFNCSNENLAECTIDGFTTQCSEYKKKEGKNNAIQ